jgi:hypothetical protein
MTAKKPKHFSYKLCFSDLAKLIVYIYTFSSHIILTKIKNKDPDNMGTLKTQILNYIKKYSAQPTLETEKATKIKPTTKPAPASPNKI